MLSTARNRVIIATSLAFAVCTSTWAEAPPPRILQEPVLGLRYELAKVKFELLPESIRTMCPELIGDDEKWRSHFWIFAQAHDAARTYYIVGGYYGRRYPEAGELSYELGDPGVAFNVDGLKCDVFGQARELFDLRDQTPLPVLKRLAEDSVARLARAFGGADRLRAEVRNQRIDQDPLSPELREAFKQFFAP